MTIGVRKGVMPADGGFDHNRDKPAEPEGCGGDEGRGHPAHGGHPGGARGGDRRGPAGTAVDGDFGRGNSTCARYYSDPNVHTNPNLGKLEKRPFTAVKIVIGDPGTKGGVVCDKFSRALRENGSVIEGLHSAAVMGHTYPEPGSTIGPAVVLGADRGAAYDAAVSRPHSTRRNRSVAAVAKTATMTTHPMSTVSTGFCIVHTSGTGAPPVLPKNSRVACTRALTGL